IMIAATFLVSIVISKMYWGYCFSPPALISDIGQIEKLTAFVPVKGALDDAGRLVFVVDREFSLAQSIASGRKNSDDALDDRIVAALNDRHLFPAADSTAFSGLPGLYPLLEQSGLL